MPIAKITGQGLLAIAFSVALLWACLIAERVEIRRAANARSHTMHEIQRMRRSRRAVPPSPVPVLRRTPVAVG